jgi:predicted dehydrogenase
MVHDIDIVLSMTDTPVTDVTASRITQERIRELSITDENCQIDVDYMDQSVQIHRHSLPEYITTDGDVRFRHESVIERPTIESGEPLKNELSSFVDSIVEGTEPRTTGRDGLRAVEVATQIEAALDPAREPVPEVGNT